MSKISENIRKYRKRKGLKQSELATLLGKAPAVISHWENDVHSPDIDIIELLCVVLDIDPDTLYGWKESEPTSEEIRETTLIDMFYLLNEEAQEMLLTHAEGLVATGKYKKDSSSGVLEKDA